ncbi:MAG: GNAT family N-acetyltransferase [Defluviitaleaceae bacterium]|nr:GNAT family N-acetyltransferase [Defluviitaleaceae bacterium]
MFKYLNFNDLSSNEIKLTIKTQDQPDPNNGILPRYGFAIIRISDNKEVGIIYFAADTTNRQYTRGHLSYGISPEYQGNNYAAKACQIIKPVPLAHGFTRLFIGSKYDNIPSIKTIEKLGAIPITKDDVPQAAILQQLQEEKTYMYVWDIA